MILALVLLELTSTIPKFMADPEKKGLSMAAATLGSGGLGFAGSVINSFVGNQYNKQSLRAQQLENEKNRQFNAQQAEISRQYGLDIMHEQQRYNSASAQVDRLIQAGLNPALAYGQIGDGSVPSPSSTPASSSGSLSPLPYNGVDPLSASTAALNFAKAKEAENAARKDYFAGTVLESQSKYAESFYSGQVDLQNATISFTGAQEKFTDQEVSRSYQLTKNLAKSTDELAQKIEESKARIGVLNEEQQIKHIESTFKSQEMHQLIRKLSAEADISEKQATQVIALGLAQMGLYEASALETTYLAKLANEQVFQEHYKTGTLFPLFKANMTITNKHMDFNFDSDCSFRNWERGLTLFNQTVGTLTDAAGVAASRGMTSLFRRSPSIGFR